MRKSMIVAGYAAAGLLLTAQVAVAVMAVRAGNTAADAVREVRAIRETKSVARRIPPPQPKVVVVDRVQECGCPVHQPVAPAVEVVKLNPAVEITGRIAQAYPTRTGYILTVVDENGAVSMFSTSK